MLLNYQEAVEVYETFQQEIRTPSLHPYYVKLDCKGNSEDKYFVYKERSNVYFHGFHLGEIPHTNYKDIQSPYGYGGPISNTSDENFLLNAWKEYKTWCQSESVIVEFIRFHPLLENEGVYHGDIFEDRKTIWIDLSQKDILSTFKTRARTAVKKALKHNIIFEWNKTISNIEAFNLLYKETMETLTANEFYFFSEEYLNQIIVWDHSYLLTCKDVRGQVIAASIFMVDGDKMEYHLSASNKKGKQICASNFIIYQAAKLAKDIGLRALHLGGGTNSKSDNSLFFFKKGFSDLQSTFNIGSYIHNQSIYEDLKIRWVRENGEIPNKILFYRF